MSNCACKISDDGTKLLSACGLHYAWARQNFGEVAREEAIEQCAKACDEWAMENHVYVNGAIRCAADIRALSAARRIASAKSE